MRLIAIWRRAIRRNEDELLRLGCAFVLLDVFTGSSGCFAPLLTPLLGVARFVGLIVLVPAWLRALALRYADRPDTELVKAVAISIVVAAIYVAARTALVVGLCAL